MKWVGVCVCGYLRSQILWGATEGLHSGSIRYALFTKPKVGDLYMAVFVQHQIFQLRNQNKKEAKGVLGLENDGFTVPYSLHCLDNVTFVLNTFL